MDRSRDIGHPVSDAHDRIVRAAHCLRQRDEHPHRASHRADEGGGGAHRPGGESLTRGDAAHDRVAAVGDGGWTLRIGRRIRWRRDLQLRIGRHGHGVLGRYQNRRLLTAVYPRPGDGGERGGGRRARATGLQHRCQRSAEGRESRGVELSAEPIQPHAGDLRNRVLLRIAGRLGADDQGRAQTPSNGLWIRTWAALRGRPVADGQRLP